MVCQPVRIALLLGAITAVAVSPARAQVAAVPAPAATPAACGACTRTIQVTECVPETYTKKVITYKRVCKTEEYDTCKLVCTNKCVEKTICVTKRIPCEEMVPTKVCKTITVNEERIVTKNCYQNVEKIVNRKHLVELGHWECRERQPLLGGLFHNDCCSPCGNSCNTGCNTGCNPCARTHKVWVCCPKYECCPVKVCERVCVPQQVKVCVPVCKRVEETCMVKRCTYKCVQEQRVIKCNVPCVERVHCKATRTVSCCVPEETLVTCTRYVQRCVTKEVPACNPCDTCCTRWGFGGFNLFHRSNGCCCR
jgi:hypothetical protein